MSDMMEEARARAETIRARLTADMTMTVTDAHTGTDGLFDDSFVDSLVNDAMFQVEVLLGELAWYQQRDRILRGTGE